MHQAKRITALRMGCRPSPGIGTISRVSTHHASAPRPIRFAGVPNAPIGPTT